MTDKLTHFADYFRKIPAAFLVAIISVLALILFLPKGIAETLAVDIFRVNYRMYLGPALLLTTSFSIARVFLCFKCLYNQKQNLKEMQKYLYKLTPEEKGYLIPYIEAEKNTVNVGLDDGIMGGLVAKGITYRESSTCSMVTGFAYSQKNQVFEFSDVLFYKTISMSFRTDVRNLLPLTAFKISPSGRNDKWIFINFSKTSFVWVYNLQPLAREYLMTNPQLLNGASGRPMAPGERYNFKS